MASHAHSTPASLLRQTTGSAGLLAASLPGGRIVAAGGPVTRALAVMASVDPDLARIRVLRRSIAARIEADLALLDALDGDPDLEPTFGYISPGHADEAEGNELGIDTDDEPWLGAPEPLAHNATRRSPGPDYPALAFGDQSTWAEGGVIGYNQHDLEDDGDDEPSLCGLTVQSPSQGGDDREAGDDNGMADEGGMHEQICRFLDAGGDMNRLPSGALA